VEFSHLGLVNVALALRFRQPGWPDCLLSGGYLLHAVGVKIRLPDARIVHPDILASSPSRGIGLLIEVKSGPNLDHDQLGRMRSVSPTELREHAYIQVNDPDTFKIGVLYLCNTVHSDSIEKAVDGQATVLGFDGRKFQLAGCQLPDDELAKALTNASVASDHQPLGIVPFDDESTDSEVATHVVPAVVAALVRGEGQLSVDGILHETHRLCCDVMQSTGAGSELRGIRRKASFVLRTAATEDFSPWLKQVERQPIYRFRKALSADRAQRTRELKSLQKLGRSLFERLGGDVQLHLALPDLDEGDE